MLRIDDLQVAYGALRVLRGITVEVRATEIVCLLGGNASGKTTTMKTILGIVKPTGGRIAFLGGDITGRPTPDIVKRGISPVPEGRRVFPEMTVRENLEMGAFGRRFGKAEVEAGVAAAFELFPRLEERRRQLAGTLSGGEQQMLAICRALMARPKLLLMDEPSMGLAPALVDVVFDAIQRINQQGTTILVVEQNANMALSVAHRGYVLQNGVMAIHGPAKDLLDDPRVQEAYLGLAPQAL